MPISRGQMPRQLYGLGSLVKSIGKAVKGAVKGVTKAVKSPLGIAALGYALGGGFSPAGFKFGTLGSKLGLGSLTGGEENVFSGGPFSGIANFVRDKITSGDKLSQMLKVGSVGGLLTGLLAKAEQGDEGAQSLTRNIPALKQYLFKNYKNLGYTDSQAQELTDKDTAEYTSGMGGYAEGGRIGFDMGSFPIKKDGFFVSPDFDKMTPEQKRLMENNAKIYKKIQESMEKRLPEVSEGEKERRKILNEIRKKQAEEMGLPSTIQLLAEGGRIGYAEGTDDYDTEFMRLVGEFMEQGFNQQEAIDAARDELERLRDKFTSAPDPMDERNSMMESLSLKYYGKPLKDLTEDEIIDLEEAFDDFITMKNKPRMIAQTGGRVQYAMGSPEENAIQASGIMGLPLNQNPAGVTELDLRETGGFIPPVGVKEKADDIPAMLSNNEFVFTADAVRGMGDGDVNKGAQRMYTMMKKLEDGGRV